MHASNERREIPVSSNDLSVLNYMLCVSVLKYFSLIEQERRESTRGTFRTQETSATLRLEELEICYDIRHRPQSERITLYSPSRVVQKRLTGGKSSDDLRK